MNPEYLRLTLNNYGFRDWIISINNNTKEAGITKSCLNIEYFGGHTEKEKVGSKQKGKQIQTTRINLFS